MTLQEARPRRFFLQLMHFKFFQHIYVELKYNLSSYDSQKEKKSHLTIQRPIRKRLYEKCFRLRRHPSTSEKERTVDTFSQKIRIGKVSQSNEKSH